MIKDINILCDVLSKYYNKYELFDSNKYKTKLKGFYVTVVMGHIRIEVSKELFNVLSIEVGSEYETFKIEHLNNIIIAQRNNKLNKI